MSDQTSNNSGFWARVRNYFLAGILVVAPISITIYITLALVHFIDGFVSKVIPLKYNPETYLPFSVPGIGVIIAFILITLIGVVTAGYLGRIFIHFGESLLNRMPFVRSVYSALKQIFETVFANFRSF